MSQNQIPTTQSQPQGLVPTVPQDIGGNSATYFFETALQKGFLEIQDGYVVCVHAAPCLENWDFYRTCTLPMQPPVKAVQKDGTKRLIIYDDPEELPYEAKVFDQ